MIRAMKEEKLSSLIWFYKRRSGPHSLHTHMDAQTPMAPFAVGVAHGEEDDFGTTDSVGAISLWIVDR